MVAHTLNDNSFVSLVYRQPKVLRNDVLGEKRGGEKLPMEAECGIYDNHLHQHVTPDTFFLLHGIGW